MENSHVLCCVNCFTIEKFTETILLYELTKTTILYKQKQTNKSMKIGTIDELEENYQHPASNLYVNECDKMQFIHKPLIFCWYLIIIPIGRYT